MRWRVSDGQKGKIVIRENNEYGLDGLNSLRYQAGLSHQIGSFFIVVGGTCPKKQRERIPHKPRFKGREEGERERDWTKNS